MTPTTTANDKTCAWCGAPATERILVWFERYPCPSEDQSKMVRKPAGYSPACTKHYKEFARPA